MREGRDRWLPTTKRGHRDKISVVLITSVCNVIYPSPPGLGRGWGPEVPGAPGLPVTAARVRASTASL